MLVGLCMVGNCWFFCLSSSDSCLLLTDSCLQGLLCFPNVLQTTAAGDTVVADHAWTNQHHLKWENTTIFDGSKNKHVLQIKEALHIQLAGWDRLFNRYCGTATLECWRSILVHQCKKHIALHPHWTTSLFWPFLSTTWMYCSNCIICPLYFFLPSVVLFTLIKAAILLPKRQCIFCIIKPSLGRNSGIHSSMVLIILLAYSIDTVCCL